MNATPSDVDAEVFARTYAGDAQGEAWHGPAFRPMLATVSAKTAAERPVPGAHTIWEIVLHLVAWRDHVCDALEGKKTRVKDDGWTTVSDETPKAWTETIRRLDGTQDRLLRGVRATASSSDPARRDQLRFLLHHDLYHAGQIGLLRKFVRD